MQCVGALGGPIGVAASHNGRPIVPRRIGNFIYGGELGLRLAPAQTRSRGSPPTSKSPARTLGESLGREYLSRPRSPRSCERRQPRVPTPASIRPGTLDTSDAGPGAVPART